VTRFHSVDDSLRVDEINRGQLPRRELDRLFGAKFRVGVGWQRNFTGGTVVIDPDPTTSQTFPLGRTYLLPPLTVQTPVTLTPGTALILRLRLARRARTGWSVRPDTVTVTSISSRAFPGWGRRRRSMAPPRTAPTLLVQNGIRAGTVLSATRRAVKGVAVLALLAVAVTAWVFVVRELTSPTRIKPPAGQAQPEPNAIVWAGRVFSSRAAIAAWLAARGRAYRHWAELHRADAAIVEHHPAAFRPPAATATAHRTAAPPANAAPPTSSSSSGGSLAWVQLVLVALAAMVMVFGAAPAAVLVRVLGVDWLSPTRRIYLLALGLSVCVGVLIAGGHL
jgi:hypothetical protein